jgi:hypothetical protein
LAKKAEKIQHTFTKRQLSHRQQQKRRQRIILSAGLIIITSVILIIGIGWFIGEYQPLHQKAISVNDTEFNMKYFINMLKLQGKDQPAENIRYLAENVIETIEQNELIRQGALGLGFNVSDDEIDEEMKSHDPPFNDAHRDLVRNQLLISKLVDGYFDQQVPEYAEQVHLMAMLLESEAQANEVRSRLENSDNFTELAGEFSLDYFSKFNRGDYGWHPEDILNELLPDHILDYISNAKVETLSRPIYDEETEKGVGYWLVKILDINEEEEEAHVNLMLLGSEKEAQSVIDKLNAGDDFADVAIDFSKLDGVEENEGEFLLSPGMTSSTVDEYVFAPEVALNTLSEPIRDETVATQGGYWLVKIAKREMDREIEDEDRDFLTIKALNEWVSSLWDNPANNIDHSYLDEDKKTWAIEQAIGRGI